MNYIKFIKGIFVTDLRQELLYMEFNQLISEIEQYVLDYFSKGVCKQYCFHNELHTNSVVSAAKEMSYYYGLNDEDRFVLITAAYFHDLGYGKGGSESHEERGAQMARDFLSAKYVENSIIDNVERCILATRMPQNPKDLLEQIICDADLFHLGTPMFLERNKLMQQEAEKVSGGKIDKAIWRENTIKLFENHQYHTEYAKDKLNIGKKDNFDALLKKQTKGNTKDKVVEEVKTSKKPERGIETMFRVTSTNSQRLSDMADNKANLLLTVNSIILSLVVTVLLRSLDKNTHLIVPTIILMSVVVIVMVLAILSTIPKIPNGYFTNEQVANKSVNLLFFGNFYKMPLETYKDSMNKVMEDRDFLYGMLSKDVYSQGVVLGRKYKLLRYAYGVFMFGLIISVLAFVFSILYI